MVKKRYRLRTVLIFLWILMAILLSQDSPTGKGALLSQDSVPLSPSISKASSPAISQEADLDSDGMNEIYTLDKHHLTIKKGTQVLWKSPKGYRVDSFVLGDPDNDGQLNLTISLWKKGSFGKFKPFWHTEEDNDYKNHLFVYKLEEDTFKSVWCSSNLSNPIESFEIRDIDEDGLNELVVKEGQYKEISEGVYSLDLSKYDKTTIWKWQEWGFELSNSESS